MGSGERQASPSGAALRGLQVAPALLAPRWPDAESRGFPEGRGRRRCGAGVGEAWWRGAVTQHPFLHRVPKTPRATPALLLRQTGPPAPTPRFFRTPQRTARLSHRLSLPVASHARPHTAHAPSTCKHMRAQVYTNTQGWRCCRGESRKEAHQQGLFRNLLSKAPTGLGVLGPLSGANPP